MSSVGSSLSLADQVKILLLRVEELEVRVKGLESNQGSSTYELVSEIPSEAAGLHHLPVVASAPQSSQLPVAPVIEPVELRRSSILEGIGHWIRSCLDNRRRGLSGRERIPEGNNIYLCFRDFSGKSYNPVKVAYTFQQIVPLVKPRGQPGDSVFIGLPSLADGRIVAEAALVSFPEVN